jgi:hypothetical protein
MRYSIKKAIVFTSTLVACLIGPSALSQTAQAKPLPKPRKIKLIDARAELPKGLPIVAYEFNFNKQQGLPNSCFTTEGMQYGNTLLCPISLDSIQAPGRIVDVDFRCSPAGGACDHTVQCPGGGICDKHSYRSDPNPDQLRNGKYRQLKWYGWTNNGGNALLTVIVYVDPTP